MFPTLNPSPTSLFLISFVQSCAHITVANQIPYDYTVEVRNRFKGLDLIDRVPDELWMEVHDIVKETGSKTILQKKKWKKSKMAV